MADNIGRHQQLECVEIFQDVVFNYLQPTPGARAGINSSLAIIIAFAGKVSVPEAGSKIVTPLLANPCVLPNSDFNKALIERVIKETTGRGV